MFSDNLNTTDLTKQAELTEAQVKEAKAYALWRLTQGDIGTLAEAEIQNFPKTLEQAEQRNRAKGA